MKVAFIYDRVNKIGGAERVLLELHAIWPDAPLYTSVYDSKHAPWARDFDIKMTFLQYIPFARNHHEWFAWLTPFAFSTLQFDEYDVVLSVTSAEAKGIITKPDTLHICYCLTPTRYLWSGVDIYKKETGFGIFQSLVQTLFCWFLPILRRWDIIASQRPDKYIAISKRVKKRIEKYYQRAVQEVIYPPIKTDFFQPKNESDGKDGYYVCVSRLVPYKRIDLVVHACTRLNRRLIVIGTGSDRDRLQTLAGPTVTFVDHYLTDEALFGYYRNCRAFIFAGDEDFGIVAGEAQASGKPIIAYKESGIAEIVEDGKTGILFASQSAKSLEKAIIQFETMDFKSSICRRNALQFNSERFRKEIQEYIETEWKRHKHIVETF